MPPSTDINKTTQGLRALHVKTDRDEIIRRHLYRLLQRDDAGNLLPVPCRFTAGLETRGIAVIEPPGGGKTTAIQHVLGETPALGQNPETGKPRSLQILVPSPASLKSVGLSILDAVGLPDVREKTPTTEIWKLVRFRLSREGIVVLWFDEAHDLIMAKSISETETSLRMIKSLMQGQHAVIPILSGTQRLGDMTNVDPQVSRRFTKIRPRDLQLGADEEAVLGLIESYCDAAGLISRVPEELASRLIVASRQRFGRSVETIIAAIECAFEGGHRSLRPEHFAEAWSMQEGCDLQDNIFEAEDWLSVQLDAGADEYEAARSRRLDRKLERG